MTTRAQLMTFVFSTGVCVLPAIGAFAGPIVGQSDTFEDGTTQNWFAGGGPIGATPPVLPANIPSGGPAGVDDNYLLLTALGGAWPGSRLSVINLTQWAGDYLAAGISAIQMDLNNFGPDDLSLRLFLADPTVGPPESRFFE